MQRKRKQKGGGESGSSEIRREEGNRSDFAHSFCASFSWVPSTYFDSKLFHSMDRREGFWRVA